MCSKTVMAFLRNQYVLSSLDSFAHLIDSLLLQGICGDTFAQGSGRTLSIREIIVDLFLIIKAVGNAGVNISQSQSGKSEGYLLRRRAVAIMIDDRIQADARAGNPDRSIRRYCEWNLLRGFNNCHDADYSRFFHCERSVKPWVSMSPSSTHQLRDPTRWMICPSVAGCF